MSGRDAASLDTGAGGKAANNNVDDYERGHPFARQEGPGRVLASLAP